MPDKTALKGDTPAKKRINPNLIAIGLLAFIVLLVFHRFFFSHDMLFSSDQMNSLDARVFMKDALVTFHQIPLWFSSRLGGMPTIDALFGDAFYPPSLVINAIASVPRGIGLKMIAHILLAGIFFFLMLRKGFNFSPLVSFAGGMFFMLNPQFLSHIYPGHDGKIYVIAWLPFIIWQLKALLSEPKLLTATFASFGIGMCILTSHIQLTYFVLWGSFLYWLMATGLLLFKEHNWKKAITISCYFWGAVFVGLGMGAMQVFPSFLYIRDAFSVRGAERGFDFAASWSLHWEELFSLWVPEFVNSLDYYWGQNPFKLNSEYVGALPMLLALGAIFLKPKNPWRIFWGGVALLSLMFALGAHTPVFHIAYAIIPGVKKFRAASMIMFWFSFSTITLASLFLKDIATDSFTALSEKKRLQWVRGLQIAAVACIALTVLFSVKGFVSSLFQTDLLGTQKQNIFAVNFTRQFLPFLWLWLLFALITVALVWGMLHNKISAKIATIVILVIGFIDIARIDAHFIKLINPAPYFHQDPALEALHKEMQTEPFRCFSLPGALPQNGEGIMKLEGVGGFHDNELHWYREFRGEQDRNYLTSLVGRNEQGQPYLKSDKLSIGNPFLNLANAKYLLVRTPDKFLTIRNENALNRLSFVPGYTVLDSSTIIQALFEGTYDYRTTVALTMKPTLPEGYAPIDERIPANVTTTWDRYTPNYRKATIDVAQSGFIRIAEVYYPGWEIRIDQKQVTYYRADLAWMAVPVTKGTHTIEMIPHSNYLSHFVFISLGIFALIALYWIITLVRYHARRAKHA